MKKIAIILSGSGVFDGTEITESILTLLHVAKAGAQYQCFAPNIDQLHTINHLTGEEMQPNRNVLVESARIARGEIKEIKELNVEDFDALILPGGFGAAKNLSDFATKGPKANMNPDILSICKSFAVSKKPAGYICISPALIPIVYGADSIATIGHDPDTASAIESLGGKHVQCNAKNIVIDEVNKVVSTPAYMVATDILEVDTGISKLIKAVINLCS
ncbi:isoprenoid biosynthesis glyoxalase ElbB [Pseudoalteromonas denitrificans]|uniref:Glyoxalase n=1 Tax=Pseudoalteromonas denitrificans DSM 6059 TaxID=1123010 RepID=A0A1I1RR34_9GAMM|nr:isoprenoid biosynthesis glyoxalase ElbB [Pseudoalteromonas denitrificans]SFD34738.1 Enhancing lycopene biosynthesis protein 2 [Pseudoalteromonas denitrificans DSM 6059]